jgi:sugar lactone lactonase YvrE
MTSKPRTPSIVASGLAFGEGPRWHEGHLWLSDMHAHRVVTVDADGGVHRVVRVAGRPSGLGWLPDGRMLIVSMEDRRLLVYDGRSLERYADLSHLAPHEVNDLVVDGEGRAYVSQFGFDFRHQGEFRKTSILRVLPDGRSEVAADGLAFPNGMVVTPDGGTLVVGESLAARLTAFDVGADGSLSNRRLFAKLEGAVPDGICLDAEGCVWVASPVSRECLRVREGGEVLERVKTEPMAIACMLGGSDRRTLYVLTSEALEPEECARRRSARVESVKVDVPGAGWP